MVKYIIYLFLNLLPVLFQQPFSNGSIIDRSLSKSNILTVHFSIYCSTEIQILEKVYSIFTTEKKKK